MKTTSLRSWTPSQFVHMSQSLAQAYGSPLDNKAQRKRHVRWTPEQLVGISSAMSCLLK